MNEDTRHDTDFPDDVVDVTVILEEDIVVLDVQDVQNAFATLFGLLYALYIDYPKELRYTFEVIHQNLWLVYIGRAMHSKDSWPEKNAVRKHWHTTSAFFLVEWSLFSLIKFVEAWRVHIDEFKMS